jgi:hypothetical protein
MTGNGPGIAFGVNIHFADFSIGRQRVNNLQRTEADYRYQVSTGRLHDRLLQRPLHAPLRIGYPAIGQKSDEKSDD